MGVSDVRQLFDEISLHARRRGHAAILKAYQLQGSELDAEDGSLVTLAEALVESTKVFHANLASHDLTFMESLPTCCFCGSPICLSSIGPFARGGRPDPSLLSLLKGEYEQVI